MSSSAARWSSPSTSAGDCDPTRPSRFVRATAIAHATLPVESGDAVMLAALHIANAFDIPKGVVRGPDGGDFTAWSSVIDLALDDLGLSAGAAMHSAPLPSDPIRDL
jgi:penicillin V acylase-like amidase (Ntn superfamily)